MGYHTSLYLFVFLPIALLAYQFTPKKMRWLTLVLSGYVFFWMISGKLVIYLIGTTIWTHYIGIWLANLKMQCKIHTIGKEKQEIEITQKQYRKKERLVLASGILLILSVLAYLKYYNFFVRNVNVLLDTADSPILLQAKTLLLPIGISFYTLQAIGYMADVYWEKISAQQHLGKIALFLGFFPQIMEGPISMYSQVTESLWEGQGITGENLSQGTVRVLWGLFKKMIIADRLYVFVSAIFNYYENYSGVIIIAAAVGYTVQLYMEFSGCMDIIIGSGKMFGVTLPENFRQPFVSRNAAEFWRRWHITLGTWFKTYIFYPVSVSKIVKKWNRFGRKKLGKYVAKVGVSAIALFPVWLCNGLWHGPRWSYIFYGMYYFVILLGGIMLEPVKDKWIKICHINEEALYYKIPQILKTWVIIFIGELFFRANGLRAGWQMFKSIFQSFEFQKLWDGTFLTFGLDKADLIVIFAGCIVVAIVGMIKERNLLGELGIKRLWLPIRWAIYYGLILTIVIFGAYGNGYQQVDMIYAGF
ncbi:MBOAT family O-acyltransferase [Extibacter muris]|uniref:MBOAT family protein n=1 Tax=Extibacter muris TaxID=1796622 RepID=A0A4R4F9B7_9FIRM|nr:MBOAT family O-acyltransferase [Extibacter muris]MCU0081158.1 MBOAT family protein [Extibacter muris]TDA20155.1 MBOAT family protein [Extibacter muris]